MQDGENAWMWDGADAYGYKRRVKKRLEKFPAAIRVRTLSLKPNLPEFFKERIEKVDKER